MAKDKDPQQTANAADAKKTAEQQAAERKAEQERAQREAEAVAEQQAAEAAAQATADEKKRIAEAAAAAAARAKAAAENAARPAHKAAPQTIKMVQVVVKKVPNNGGWLTLGKQSMQLPPVGSLLKVPEGFALAFPAFLGTPGEDAVIVSL